MKDTKIHIGQASTTDTTRKKPACPTLFKICVFFGIIILFTVIYFENITHKMFYKPRYTRSLNGTDQSFLKYFIDTPGCKIPNVDPHDKQIFAYLKKPKTQVCDHGKPPLFEANLTSIYMINSSLKYYTNDTKINCCYLEWKQVPLPGNNNIKITYGNTCHDFFESTNISVEFIKVVCFDKKRTIYTDMFSFVPLRKNIKKTDQNRKNPNILIIGLDAVSRLTLQRQMPKTVRRLRELRATEMMGYHKLEEDPYLYLIPALTGLKAKEFKRICLPNSELTKCRFIWQNYKKKGYVTAFGKDTTRLEYRNNIASLPNIDYWYSSFQNNETGSCTRSRFIYQDFLDYIKKFITSMDQNNLPYFAFFWEVILHQDLLSHGDRYYDNFLMDLERNGYLNNTFLIFMSDGNIETDYHMWTYAGRLEQRLPFLWIRVPHWFKIDRSRAYFNLALNSKKLTTHLDLHATLVDLLQPYSISEYYLDLSRKSVSLFKRICKERTCDNASIPKHLCTCLQSGNIINTDDIVQKCAKLAVSFINENLKPHSKLCEELTLKEILSGERFFHDKSLHNGADMIQDFVLEIVTEPGRGVFEATVRHFITNDQFEVVGKIYRLNNVFYNETHCTKDSDTRLYCYCKTLLK